MNDWPRIQLGEILDLHIDAVQTDPTTEYPIAGVYSFGRGLFQRGPLVGSETTYKKFHRLNSGDLVISQLKAWEGAIALVSPEFDGWFLSPQFPTFRVRRDAADAGFINWYCKRPSLWVDLERGSRGMGARRNSVAPKQFLGVEIPLPPLPEQRRIVAKIERLAAKVEEGKALREAASSMANSLLQAASSDFFECSGTTVPVKTLGSLVHRVTKGESPSWQGYSYQDRGVVFVRSENVRWGELNLDFVKYVPDSFNSKLSRSQLKAGDVLVNLVGASIGRACVVPEDIGEANVNQAVAVITPRDSVIDSRYIMRFILSPPTQSVIHGGKVETARPNISLTDLKKLPVPVPSIPEQEHVVSHLEDLQAKTDSLEALQRKTAAQLDALLPSILDKAFRGEL